MIRVDYGTDQLGLTQTQNLTPAELLRHHQQISNLAEGIQGRLFAIDGAIAPCNGIYYEPMRFGEGPEEKLLSFVRLPCEGVAHERERAWLLLAVRGW